MATDPRPPASPPEPPAHRAGQTTPVKDDVPAHQQPHERDESSASQQRAPDPVMQQAHDDVERGLTDTSRGEATDKAYARHLRSEPQASTPAPTPAGPGKPPDKPPGKPR